MGLQFQSSSCIKEEQIKRFYYIDIEKAISPDIDRLDAIISVPENRIVTSNFGRTEDLNISTREKEFENKLFPLNIILDFAKIQDWQNNYYAFYNYDGWNPSRRIFPPLKYLLHSPLMLLHIFFP